MILEIWVLRPGKIDDFIRVSDGTRYFVLFGSKKCYFIYNKTQYLIGIKRGKIYFISYSYAKIKVTLCDSLPLEKTMTFHNVMVLINSVFSKDKNNCYYKKFVEKASYESPKG